MTRAEDTRTAILDIAERFVQQRGYNGFSYRDIAAEIGIKTASIHYHFPTKAALGEAVARRYVDRAFEGLELAAAQEEDGAALVAMYVDLYRQMLRNDRMCLCGMLAAEVATLPEGVATQSARFMRQSIQWLETVLGRDRDAQAAHDEAMRVLALLEGGQLIARATGDPSVFDEVVGHLAG